MLRRVLRLANYRVSTFASGEQFLESLATSESLLNAISKLIAIAG